MSSLSWQDRAACVGIDPDLFFPPKGYNNHRGAAKRICFGCPVRLECLHYALEHSIAYGIWGGRNERERRGMRVGRKEAV